VEWDGDREELEGVVWCGVVWCGMALCGMVWCGVVWYGMVWYGVPRRAQCKGVPRAKACVTRQATRKHMHSDIGLEWVVWYGMVWCGMVCQGVPSAKAFQWPRRSNGQGVCGKTGTGRRMHSDVRADTAGERASKHGGWWERGLGQGLSAFLDKFVWTLSEHWLHIGLVP
jgi:hypothetical protein